jgi:hypothetical protein
MGKNLPITSTEPLNSKKFGACKKLFSIVSYSFSTIEPDLFLLNFYFPHWFHLQKNVFANSHVSGLFIFKNQFRANFFSVCHGIFAVLSASE